MRRLALGILAAAHLAVALVACRDDSTGLERLSRAQIAFASTRDGNDEIYVMNADGSNQVNLTNHWGNDIQPTWSPDGTRIAFMSDRDGIFDIYVMGSDGSNPVNLTNNPTRYDAWPTWSPDGTRIAFVSLRDEGGIYVMGADGSDPVLAAAQNCTDVADENGTLNDLVAARCWV
jgi:Tol biopolymer transport system component